MRDLLSFQHSRCSSFLPNNQMLFPAVPPEREQETLLLPDSAEPQWPRVSFGNTDHALFYFQSVPPCFSSAPGQGAWPGKRSSSYWLYASMP